MAAPRPAGRERGRRRSRPAAALVAGALLALLAGGVGTGLPVAWAGPPEPPPAAPAAASADLGPPPHAVGPASVPAAAPVADPPAADGPPAPSPAPGEGAPAGSPAPDDEGQAAQGDEGGKAPAGPEETCPPLRVTGELDPPLRRPWEPHQPAYYEGCEPTPPCGGEDHSRITDEYIRPDPCNVPTRPSTLLEIGDPFMSPGTISPGTCTPTGAVVQPRLLMYGNYRTALQAFDGGAPAARVEWVNRLDLFFNYQISATERVLLGFRPLSEGTEFSGYEFRPRRHGVDGFNAKVTTLYFEGEVGEIFPRLSPGDVRPWDIGFAVGRQPITTQGGIMINDDLDSFGLTRNAWRPAGTSNVLVSGLVAWNDIDRGFTAVEDEGALLLALHSEIDTRRSFLELDVASVLSDDASFGDAVFLGAGATQRFGRLGTTLRVNQSIALQGTTPATGTGTLVTGEFSITPPATHDAAYANVFGAFGQYDSAARRPESGGPLGGLGVQFASAGIGRAGAPLSPRAKDVLGGALGYQRFFCGGRSNLLFELAGRASTAGPDTSVVSGAVRYQRALGQRIVLTAMGFAGWVPDTGDATYGARFEFQVKF